MRLQDQCCTLEQGKRLKEMGIIQIGLFGQIEHPIKQSEKVPHIGRGKHDGEWHERYVSLFTCAELGEMCPYGMHTYYSDHTGFWHWQIIEPNPDGGFDVIDGGDEYETEAEARGDCLITSIEKGYSVEDVNKILQS